MQRERRASLTLVMSTAVLREKGWRCHHGRSHVLMCDPHPGLGAASSGPGAWDFGETSGAFCFLFGATMWEKQLMAAHPCSHIPATKAPKTKVRMGKDVVRGSSPVDQEAAQGPCTYLSVCLSASISILLALPCSLTTVGALRGAGRAEVGSPIPGKGTHRSWKKKT